MMDHTCSDLEGTFPYMDDSRVASPDKETHLKHLDKFDATLAANGLAINLENCVFVFPTVEFLGHRISATGFAPAVDHAAKRKNCLPPRTSSNCNVFLAW